MSREIDALVAKHVMGWRVVPAGTEIALPTANTVGVILVNDDLGKTIEDLWLVGNRYYVRKPSVPRYSTRIEDTWKVVEKLRPQMNTVTIEWDTERQEWWIALTEDPDDAGRWWTKAETTIEMAICVAALKAAGVEIDP